MVSKVTTWRNIKKFWILLTERIYLLRAESYGKQASRSGFVKDTCALCCGVGTKVFGITHEVKKERITPYSENTSARLTDLD